MAQNGAPGGLASQVRIGDLVGHADGECHVDEVVKGGLALGSDIGEVDGVGSVRET
jgi:hypothetical protein